MTIALNVRNTLKSSYSRATLHNRVSMILRLHDLMVEDGMTFSKHHDSIDEIFVGLQTLNEHRDKARQFMILL